MSDAQGQTAELQEKIASLEQQLAADKAAFEEEKTQMKASFEQEKVELAGKLERASSAAGDASEKDAKI